MGLPGISAVGGNLKDEKLRQKIASFFGKYIDVFQNKLKVRNLQSGMFSFGRPTNYYFAIDRKLLNVIYSTQFAGGISEILYIDLRNQEKESFTLQEVAMFLKAQKGITSWTGIPFSIDVIDYPEEKQNTIIDVAATTVLNNEFKALIRQFQPLFIPIEQIKKFLEVASEDDLVNILLVPLLRHIGFDTAESKGHRDRALEFGQDIQKMKLQIPTGHWLYFSAQVKKGDIKANTKPQKNYVERVLSQTQAQLEWEMPDSETNQNVKPDHILLIVSGNITEGAKQYIFNHSLYRRKRVLLWEKETILRLCAKKGLPETVQNTILEYNKNIHN